MNSTTLRNSTIPVSHIDAGLRVSEIFYSLQGEARDAGKPTVFIRLTGCPLRCTYCDTSYAFEGGERMALDDILAHVAQYNAAYVCVTGGEPLAQPNCIPLLVLLCDAGYSVSLETSGALDIASVDKRVSRVLDLKTPDSGESSRNLLSNIDLLTNNDQVKFVITSRIDYLWSQQMLMDHKLHQKVNDVWFSPCFSISPSNNTDSINHPNIKPNYASASLTATNNAQALPALAQELANWILEDALPVRLQLQLHKLIWQDAKGR